MAQSKNLPSKLDAAIELEARRSARGSLLAFAEYTHKDWQMGPHHARICDALERVERGECKRMMIFAPPRHGKSELASRRFPAWYLGRHPESDVIATSYNDDLAKDFGRDVRGIVRGEPFRRLFPGIVLAQDSSAAGRWHTNHGGQYVSVGIGGTLTGRGGKILIIDDPIKNREEADSERVQESMWKWYTSTLRTRLAPGGSILMMLTRWTESDLAARAMDAEKWEVVELQAIESEDGQERALWPERFPLEELQATRTMLRKSGRSRDWEALYQQRPTAESGAYIMRKWFPDRWDTLPKVKLYGYSDLAVTEPREGADPDSTEHGLWGVDSNDTLYDVDWWHGQTTPDVWIDALLDLIAKHKPNTWFIEGGVIRRAVEPFLLKRMRERKVYCRIEWVNPISDKATRARAFQARAAMGKVRFSREERSQRVIDQCVAFPGGRHDDAFDVCSGICQVIDQAHPAIADKPTKPVDRWARIKQSQGGKAEKWKVV